MSGPVVRPGARPLEVRLGAAAAIIAIAWAALALDPLGPATIDPDASSSVLYFLRIVHGERLEAFVPTTPKPLLTLVYGLTWAIGHDWRWLAWETIAIFGLAVGATTALVARLAARAAVAGTRAAAAATAAFAAGSVAAATRAPAAVAAGSVAAAAFATAALLGSSDLLLEVSRANSLVWALGFWALAGLAATGTPARPRWAGAFLLLAGLCRFETLALAAVGLGAVAVARWRARRGGQAVLVAGFAEAADAFSRRRASVSRAAAAVAVSAAVLALAALPVALVHDWLLTGDPTYFLRVPERYTQVFNPGLVAISPLDYAGTLAGRLSPEWPLLLLAALGIAALARTGEWLVLAGVLAIGLGVVALLFTLAARATYISNRYYEPIDLVLVVAAAVAVGWLSSRLPADRPASAPMAAAAAAIAGIAIMWPGLPWDRRAVAELGDVRRSSAHLATVRPDLERTLTEGQTRYGQDAATELLVPGRDVSRLSVEIGQPLQRIVNSYAVLLNRGVAGLEPGQVVFHDGAADRPVALYRALEIDDQEPVGGNILVRLDPRIPEIWLLSVR